MTQMHPGDAPGRPYDAPPPTAPYPAPVPPMRPGWPIVIGIIAIVLGSLGLICNASAIAQPLFLKMVPIEPWQKEINERWMPATIPLGMAQSALGALLLACGIGLLRRQPWAARGVMVWAPLSAVVSLAGAWVGYMIQSETLRAMPAIVGGPVAPAVFAWVGIAVGLIFALGPPIFVVIWFTRGSVRREVSAWVASRERQA